MNPEVIVGRPVSNGVFMQPHEKFLTMEIVLENAERTLAEIVHDMYTVLYVQTGRQYALARLFYYLKRNLFSR